jgi:hypothetical protein
MKAKKLSFKNQMHVKLMVLSNATIAFLKILNMYKRINKKVNKLAYLVTNLIRD